MDPYCQDTYYFLTMAVLDLYLNIGHERGIHCTEFYLMKDQTTPQRQKAFIIDGIKKIFYFRYIKNATTNSDAQLWGPG